MSEGIPDGISAEDIRQAIRNYDAGARHDFGDSTRYDLVVEGRRYPPKAILGLAARRVAGRDLGPYDFKGGLDSRCFRILEGAGFDIVPKDGNEEDWSEEEFRAAVEAYMGMLGSLGRGEPVNKADVNRQLRAGSLWRRSKGSIEYRMQNISAVLETLGAAWIEGYKPMRNVGASGREQILAALRETGSDRVADFLPSAGDDEVIVRTKALRGRHRSEIEPTGNDQPRAVESQVTRYQRLPGIRAWVLQAANGRCELCDVEAPFVDADGLPYLEVHHIVTLAEGGPDTISNTVALCPNCHRKLHLARERREHIDAIYKKLQRLRRPGTPSP